MIFCWSRPKDTFLQVRIGTHKLLFSMFLTYSLPAPITGAGRFLCYSFLVACALTLLFFFCSGCGSAAGGTSSVIFNGDRCQIRTAGESGCWSFALPSALHRQCSLLSTENHSLGEWFKKRLLPIMKKITPSDIVEVRSGNCKLQNRGRSFKNERHK